MKPSLDLYGAGALVAVVTRSGDFLCGSAARMEVAWSHHEGRER
jgi:hypothetical protein